MNEQTEKLIREFAEKLGTTTDHLWGMLVRQARLNGLANLFIFAAVIGLLAASFVWFRKKTTDSPGAKEHNRYGDAEWDDDAKPFVWGGWCLLCLIGSVWILGAVPETIGSFLNPEYFAYHEILRVIGR